MMVTSFGDMAQHFLLGQRNGQLKDEITTLSQILATGQVSDFANQVTGDYTILGDIERSMTTFAAYTTAVSEAQLFVSTAQDAFETIQSGLEGMANDMLTATQSGVQTSITAVAQNAKDVFLSVVQSLNTSVAGRSIFSGIETGGAALTDGDSMLESLRSSLTGNETAAEIEAVVEDWFMSDGGGFETEGYIGADTDLADFQLDQRTKIDFSIRADSEELRGLLAEAATAALVSDSDLALPDDVATDLLQGAAEGLFSKMNGLISLRAQVGSMEERISDASARNETAIAALELSKSDLISVDSYETATRLEEARIQLETLYTVTARLSNLTLANYLG